MGEKTVWDLLVKHGKDLVETGFGYKDCGEDVKAPGKEICHRGIEIMLEVRTALGGTYDSDNDADVRLQLESPNLHELGLDRVIAFGHTWSPTLELTPRIPLRHGHAITVSVLPLLIYQAGTKGEEMKSS